MNLGKKPFYFLLVIIFLALIAGGALAYTTIFEASQSAITESFTMLTNARALHQDVAIKATLTSPIELVAEGNIAMDIEQGATGPRRMATTVTGKASGFSAGFELRFLDETLYGKVDEFPFLSFLFPASASSSSPIGRWFSVTIGEIEEFSVKQGIGHEDIAKFRTQFEKIGESNAVGQVDSLFDSLIQSGALMVGKRAALARVAGAWVRQYTMAIDKDKLAAFMLEKGKELLLTDLGGGIPPKEITDSLEMITFDPIIVTMNLFNGSIRSIVGGVELASNRVSFVVTYRDINGPITVTKPANATPLIPYIEQSMVEMGGAASTTIGDEY
ncbi:MAG: hypothetical protein AAB415_02135 [Patescibacteria group bacterium]